ncbi:MAG: FAD:protein FMN transferase [Clostridia bacterium]|nr:FAD:protein FMN transferase [Clostridia bacterium]
MKKILFIIPLFLSLALVSCSPTRYNTQLFGYFDTVVSVDGYFESKGEFERACELVKETLKEYDAIFDIYTDGELKHLNDTKKAEVSLELANAIAFGIKAEKATKGYCNIAMGSVLSLWHQAREADVPYLPDRAKLEEAARHTDVSGLSYSAYNADKIEITLTDKETSLDMGAIAKGIVSDVLRERLVDAGFDNMYVNMGGNVVTIGNKDGEGWNVGIQDPANEAGIVEAVKVTDSCLVTSGSYQRYFEYDGKRYHHIISPDTLYPSDKYLSVSVLYENGAWADALSTALFNMDVDEGKAVLEQFDNIGVMWITTDNEYIYYGTLE